MQNELTRKEIRDKLATVYQDLYGRYSFLMDEAEAARLDEDEDADLALTRRAGKVSDIMDGIGIAAEVLGIMKAELKASVNDPEEEP